MLVARPQASSSPIGSSAVLFRAQALSNGLFGVAQYNDGLGIFVINDHDILESIFFTESGIRQFALSHGGDTWLPA